MDVLSPGALWYVLLLAALLLLPHLKRPRTRRAISNAYLWRQVAPAGQPRRRIRLQKHALLLLQAAVLLLLIAALARPVLFSGGRRVAIVMDLSASMGARDGNSTRLAQACERALATVAALPRRSRVRVVAARTVAADLGEFTASDSALRSLLGRLEAGGGTAALDAAISTARAASTAAAEVHVFTDQPQPPASSDVDWVRVGRPVDNVAVTTMAVRRLPGSPLDAQILVQIRNFGASTRDVPVTLRNGAIVIARDVVTLGPQATRTLVHDVADPSGVYTAAIDSPDALALDNTRFTLMRSAERIRVLLVTSGNFFLEQALATNPALDVRTISPSEFARAPRPAAGVIVCDGCRELPATRQGVLMIPARSGPPVPAALRITSPGHPVTALLTVDDVLASPSGPMSVPAGATILVRAGAAPAVVAYDTGTRRVVGLNLDVTSSNLPLHVAFPVLLANAIDWLSASDASPAAVVAGEPVRWTTLDDEGQKVSTPQGRTLPLVRSGGAATFTSTEIPGVYRILGGTQPAAFVANVADSESDLSAGGPAPAAGANAGASSRTQVSTELFVAFILAALGIVAIEWREYCRRMA